MRAPLSAFWLVSCLGLLLMLGAVTGNGQRVRLRSQITPDCPAYPGTNPNWKFSDVFADGPIAVQGSYNCRGAFIYDITNMDAPVLANWYNPPRATDPNLNEVFLEAVVIGSRGYFGSTTGGGVHIVDLTDPYRPVLLGVVNSARGNAFNSIHEMVVFQQNGATILVENFALNSTKVLKFINITDPANPVFIRDLVPTEPRWVHGIHIRGNRMFTSGWGNGTLARGRTEIYDITSIALQAPGLLGYIEDASANVDAGNQMHSSWSSEDGNYLYSAREVTNSNGPTPGDIRVYDIRNPEQPLLVNSISMASLGLNAVSPHNPVVMGNYLYVSWYQAGVQIFDLTNPASPRRVGQYDTFQATYAPPPVEKISEGRTRKRRVVNTDAWDVICGRESVQSSLPSEYNGNWAVYPFLGQDKVLAGDMLSGLMILDASSIALPLKNRVADFDGDRRTDLSVFRPSTGEWEVEQSTGSFQTSRVRLGTTGDQVAAGDYDGDGRSELAVFHPSTAQWTIRKPFTRQYYFSGVFGLAGDIAVPADYDADGRTDLAVWRPSAGSWYIRRSTLGETNAVLGSFGDKPLTGDYDGDGKADIATWRPSNGLFTFRHSSSSLTFSVTLGESGDKPQSADFDGNGITDLVVYRPSNGTWYVLDPITNVSWSQQWGLSDDIPIPADYDGDGKADLCVFRPSTNEWYRVNSSNGAVVITTFGKSGDVPVPLSVQPQ